ncbi:hypothetical protein CGC55_07085 [Capnocytophaga sputigena]|uniref:Transposase n=1 Tax=Capnocytophaga sputigena TaxID=1019 RepID=A0ABM6MJU3_CAPSP|nr:hypothetical protein CGC55_07085 [Capnocytophaga sputigena]
MIVFATILTKLRSLKRIPFIVLKYLEEIVEELKFLVEIKNEKVWLIDIAFYAFMYYNLSNITK